MNLLWKDKLVLVTGGGSSLGLDICYVLAKEGATVVVTDSNGKAAEETFNKFPGKRHISVTLDITNIQNISSLFDMLQRTFKRLPSILINCIDITEENIKRKTTVAHFQEILGVHLVGMLAVMKATSTALIKERLPGSIINVVGAAGKDCTLGCIFYTVVRSAVDTLTESVAKEIAK